MISSQEVSTLSSGNGSIPVVTGGTRYSYQTTTLFSLEEKLQDSVFQKELQQQPVIWGASRNGRYLVTLAYDSEQNACQLDLIDVYYQKKVMGFVLDFIQDQNSERIEEEIEQIRLVEQALKEAYRIETPVPSSALLPNKKRVIHEKEIWWLTPFISSEMIQVVADQKRAFQYVVFEWKKPTTTAVKQSFVYQLKMDSMNYIVIFVQLKSGNWEVMIRSLDFGKWSQLPSEEQLKKRCAQLLNETCQVIYRDPVSFRFYLMGSDGWETKISEKGYISYIKSFVLLNQQGEPMIIGTSKKLEDAKGDRTGGSDFYRIYMEVPESGKRRGRLWVDGFDSNYRLIFTRDWRWSEARNQFE